MYFPSDCLIPPNPSHPLCLAAPHSPAARVQSNLAEMVKRMPPRMLVSTTDLRRLREQWSLKTATASSSSSSASSSLTAAAQNRMNAAAAAHAQAAADAEAQAQARVQAQAAQVRQIHALLSIPGGERIVNSFMVKQQQETQQKAMQLQQEQAAALAARSTTKAPYRRHV